MNELDDVESPPGVELVGWDDFPRRRQQIFDATKAAVDSSYPQTYGGVRLELHNTHYDSQEPFSTREVKSHLMENKFLHRRLRGTWKLFDEKTGEKLDEREATVDESTLP